MMFRNNVLFTMPPKINKQNLHITGAFRLPTMYIRVGVNSAPELDFLANSKSNSRIGIELELALLSPGGIGIELELPSFELELESELLSSELNSELPSWN